ncbi:MAG: hypothetical protein JWP03_964 [Phycisphaerales bacterium]|jgi:hypothetical protein|nr:hypothetical protein [Phycisphaerales bacterium]
MTAQKLTELLWREPFIPVRFRLDDGENIVIATPLRALVSGEKLYIGWSKDPFAPPEKRRLRVIPVERVEEAKDIDPKRLRRRR